MSKSSYGSTTRLTKSTPFTMEVDPLNPRQYEVYDSQSRHQKNLNYIEFMARLGETTRSKPFNYQNYSPNKTNNSRDYDVDSEVADLELTLQKEIEKLNEAKASMKRQLEEAHQALDDFHKEKQEKQRLNKQKLQRRMHEEELRSLRLKVEAAEIDMKLSAEQSQYLEDPEAEPLTNFDKSFELRRKLAQTDLDSTDTKEILNKQRESK